MKVKETAAIIGVIRAAKRRAYSRTAALLTSTALFTLITPGAMAQPRASTSPSQLSGVRPEGTVSQDAAPPQMPDTTPPAAQDATTAALPSSPRKADVISTVAEDGDRAQASSPDIIVTGSRIVRDGYKAPTPLSVIGAEQLATNANSNIAQFITTLPVFAGSSNSRSSTTTGASGAAGINSLNLRALGANRTLVLLDGHRVAPATATGIVDVNAIPQALISRVDVVTGGASATYGSDAVAGVVNFVLDKTMTGIRAELSGGITSEGDGENYKVSLAAGRGFADGRGHLLFAGEQVDDQGIGAGQRDWTRRGFQLLTNPAYTSTNGQPQRLILSNVGYLTAAPGGVVASGPLRGTAFGSGGQPYQQNLGDIQAEPFQRGGDWQRNDLRPFNTIAPKESRQTAFGRASYEIARALNIYGQLSFIRARTRAESTKIYMIGPSGPLIMRDNAFLPLAVRDRMIAAGLTSIRVGTLNDDLGVTYQTTERKATSYQVGADGRFNMLRGGWRWDAYLQHGRSHSTLAFPNNISRRNYALASDAVANPATGTVVCRSTLTSPNNGCFPYNALGVGVNDPNGAAVRYIRSASEQDLTVRQTVAAASLTGEPFSTWAGPVSVAVSAEYRKDAAKSIVDAGSLAVDHIYANYSAIDGSTNVKEVAFETVIPLANGSGWADSWDFNGAVRFTSYSDAGSVTTWKIGTTYSPIPDLIFRATRSRDIRAPNLNEGFLPTLTVRQSFFDPFTNTTASFNQTTTGNRELRPEKADTLGLGIVLTPSFLAGFNVSADYWTINIKDAISTIAAADVLLLCFDGSRPELCANITRVNGNVTDVISQNINIASQKVRGLDFEASYRHELADVGLPGNIDVHVNLTRYLEDTIDNGVSQPRDLVGENSGPNPPRWRTSGTFGYSLDSFRSIVTARAFSSGKQFANFIQCTSGCPAATTENPTVNRNFLPGRFYLDLSLGYDFSIGGNKNVSAFFNVRNLTNRDPGLSVAVTTVNAFAAGANALLYDVDGRTLRAGLRIKI